MIALVWSVIERGKVGRTSRLTVGGIRWFGATLSTYDQRLPDADGDGGKPSGFLGCLLPLLQELAHGEKLIAQLCRSNVVLLLRRLAHLCSK